MKRVENRLGHLRGVLGRLEAVMEPMMAVPGRNIQGRGGSPPLSVTYGLGPALAGGGKGEGLRLSLRREYQKKLSHASDPRGVGGLLLLL